MQKRRIKISLKVRSIKQAFSSPSAGDCLPWRRHKSENTTAISTTEAAAKAEMTRKASKAQAMKKRKKKMKRKKKV